MAQGDQTRKVLAFIVREVVWAGRPFPTMRQVAMHMGWTVSTAHQCISRLIRWGAVERYQDGRCSRYRLREEYQDDAAATG